MCWLSERPSPYIQIPILQKRVYIIPKIELSYGGGQCASHLIYIYNPIGIYFYEHGTLNHLRVQHHM